MKARDLDHHHVGQTFKISNPAKTITGGLSDFHHTKPTPGSDVTSTYVWINGVQLQLHPDTTLTFVTKETK